MKKLLLAILAIMLLGIVCVAAASFSIVSLNSGSGDIGDSVSYTLELQNDDAVDLSFTCTSTDLTDGTYTIVAPTISDITGIGAGLTGTSDFSITVPQNIGAGTYTSTVTCTENVDLATQQTTLTLTVNSADAFTTSISTLDVEVLPDNSEDSTISVTNTGSSTLAFHVDFVSDENDDPTCVQDGPCVMEDNDGDPITLTFTNIPTALAPGDSADITLNTAADDDIDSGEPYEGVITLSAGTATAEILLDVDLDAEICEDGLQGNKLEVTIDEPDNGDDFTPGESITVEFEVQNDDNDDIDVEIELILWDLTEGEEVRTENVDTVNIDDDEEQDFDVEFELPTDIDEDNTYYLYVKVNEDGDEDDECTYERVRIDFDREDDDVRIISTSVSPSDLECGDSYVLEVEVESVGNDEQDNVYIEIGESELDISESTPGFDLGDYNDNDNDYTSTFNLNLPEDLVAGTYYIDILLYDESGDLFDSELISIDVDSCSADGTDGTDGGSTTEPNDDLVSGVEIELSVDNDFDVEGQDQLTIPLIIQNMGDEDSTISLKVDDVNWGDIEGTEYLSSIKAGQSLHAYVYLNLETDTTGVHDLVIEVQDADGDVVSELISLDFGEGNEITGNFAGISDWDTTLWFWILGIIILVVILIILVRLLTR
ncbi:putative S-layer protein [archaeon]|jgi:hypothetical protein|nr:putative S-layer protein [archaeon]MBT4397564.1 putative S-layer protein [archaeon]MBT4440819.1 putative S-layer protein [archaeon]